MVIGLAQNKRMNVTGYVIDKSGEPASNVIVTPVYRPLDEDDKSWIGGTVESTETSEDGRFFLKVDWDPRAKLALQFESRTKGCIALLPPSVYRTSYVSTNHKSVEISSYNAEVNVGTIDSYLEFASFELDITGFSSIRLEDNNGNRIATKPIDYLNKSSQTIFCLPTGDWRLALASRQTTRLVMKAVQIDKHMNVKIRDIDVAP